MKKQQLKGFPTVKGLWSLTLSDEKMKKFAVMLNNLYAFRIKESCTMTELC
jgi:hypothetical protein